MTEVLDTYITDIEKSFSLVKSSLASHKQAPISIFFYKKGKK